MAVSIMVVMLVLLFDNLLYDPFVVLLACYHVAVYAVKLHLFAPWFVNVFYVLVEVCHIDKIFKVGGRCW